MTSNGNGNGKGKGKGNSKGEMRGFFVALRMTKFGGGGGDCSHDRRSATPEGKDYPPETPVAAPIMGHPVAGT
jgi:hypothetical protein